MDPNQIGGTAMRERVTGPTTRLRTLALLIVVGFLVLTAGAGPNRAAASDSGTKCPVDHSDPERTVQILTDPNAPGACNQSQIDALYGSLPAGPMPAYGSRARGYWRWSPNFVGPEEVPMNRFVNMAIWQGGTFYTNADGGFKENRVFADKQTLPGKVYYGPGYFDGGRAIIVDYKAEEQQACAAPSGTDCAGVAFMALWFRDECRQAQHGIWLCYGWKPVGKDAENEALSNAVWSWSTAQAPDPANCLTASTRPCDQNRITFVLDFVHSDVPFTDCPQCSVVHALPTASPTPGVGDV
jgi:hypothetical protein